MSDQELTVLVATMKELCYPRPILMNSFQNPNFELVADMLQWLVRRYVYTPDSNDCGIHASTATEDDRVQFINSVIKVVAIHYGGDGIQLNAMALYGAETPAINELLKLASALNGAVKIAKQQNSLQGGQTLSNPKPDPEQNEKIILLAAELSKKAHKFQQILELETKETESNQDIKETLNSLKSIEANPRQVEQSLKESLNKLKEHLSRKKRELRNSICDLKEINVALDRKQQEMERMQIQLANVKAVRPAYLDEYEALEEQHHRLYEDWISRYKNVDYMEREVKEMREYLKDQAQEQNHALQAFRQSYHDYERKLHIGDQETLKSLTSREPLMEATAKQALQQVEIEDREQVEEIIVFANDDVQEKAPKSASRRVLDQEEDELSGSLAEMEDNGASDAFESDDDTASLDSNF